MGEAYVAIFLPTQRFKKRTFVSFGFSKHFFYFIFLMRKKEREKKEEERP